MAGGLGSYWELYQTYINNPIQKITLIGIIVLVQSLMAVLNPQILGMYVDYVLSGSPLPIQPPIVLIGTFILITAFTLFVGTYLVWITEKIGWEATNRLRKDLMENVLSQGREFFLENKPGEVIEKIDGDVMALSGFFSKIVSSIVANGLLLLLIIVFIGTVHWAYSIAFFFLILITIVMSNEGRKRIMTFFLKERQASASLFGIHEDLLSAKEDLLGIGETEYPFKRASVVEANKFESSLKTQLAARVFNIFISLAVALGSILPYVVGVPLFSKDQISIGDIFLVSFYATMIFLPTFEIIRQIDTLQRAEASLTRISQIQKNTLTISEASMIKVPVIECIKFNNIRFEYSQSDDFALEVPSVEFRKGELNGLVGRTGSGKTSLLRLLLRTYEPNSGHIDVNGIDIHSFKIDEYQSRFLWISQAGGLFPGTILENLTFYETMPDLERLTSLLKKFELWGILAKVNNDLNAEISSLNLSEGQIQLFEIVRAAYFDPEVLILDEATSSTDEKVTKHIFRYLNEVKKDKLIIFVAHQPDTLKRLDHIVQLNNGKVTFSGKSAMWRGFVREASL